MHFKYCVCNLNILHLEKNYNVNKHFWLLYKIEKFYIQETLCEHNEWKTIYMPSPLKIYFLLDYFLLCWWCLAILYFWKTFFSWKVIFMLMNQMVLNFNTIFFHIIYLFIFCLFYGRTSLYFITKPIKTWSLVNNFLTILTSEVSTLCFVNLHLLKQNSTFMHFVGSLTCCPCSYILQCSAKVYQIRSNDLLAKF